MPGHVKSGYYLARSAVIPRGKVDEMYQIFQPRRSEMGRASYFRDVPLFFRKPLDVVRT